MLLQAHQKDRAEDYPARGEFDLLAGRPLKRVSVSIATADEVADLVVLAAQEIPALAAQQATVRRIHAHDPAAVWAFRYRGRLAGTFALLHLNPEGHRALLERSFEFASPSLPLLSAPADPVAAIYMWALVAPGIVAEGIHAVSAHLQTPRYARADLYSRAVGAAAERINRHYGFRPMAALPPFLKYVRMTNRALERAA